MSENKKLLSRRLQVVSVQLFIEQNLQHFVEHFELNQKQSDEMKQGLMKLSEQLLNETFDALVKGAERGISEAISLIQDPKYYETASKRNKKHRNYLKDMRSQNKQREVERKRRLENPTFDEQKQDVRRALKEMIYDKDRYKKHKQTVIGFVSNHSNKDLEKVIEESFEHHKYFDGFDIDKFVESLTMSKISDNSDDDDFFSQNDLIN